MKALLFTVYTAAVVYVEVLAARQLEGWLSSALWILAIGNAIAGVAYVISAFLAGGDS